MKRDALSSISSNRNRLVRRIGGPLFALLAAACSSQSGEATSSQDEALKPLPCFTPAPTATTNTLAPGDYFLIIEGEGFEHFDCRLPFGGDNVTISVTPYDANGDAMGATRSFDTISGGGIPEEDAAATEVGAIYFSISLIPTFGCNNAPASLLVNVYDNTTNTVANNGIGTIVRLPSPFCQ